MTCIGLRETMNHIVLVKYCPLYSVIGDETGCGSHSVSVSGADCELHSLNGVKTDCGLHSVDGVCVCVACSC